ncbi:MAG: prenyltransferase [Firmicutes bacterium]|nr:prenyltransferase [Bacillota bacterium]
MTYVWAVLPSKVRELYKLIRFLPVFAWGISSSLLGLGFAWQENKNLSLTTFGLIVMMIVLIHGVISHAYNDREDWLSGTDQNSPGILSGGSGVIVRGGFSLGELLWVGRTAAWSALLIGAYFWWRFGIVVVVLLVVAIWSAIAYSCAPLRLAYHPLSGEWLCAFPALFAAVTGTYYLLVFDMQPAVLIAGAIHALLAMGLLMHNHISDVSSDLTADPQKLTTVALVASKIGMPFTPLVEVLYFSMALLLGIWGGINFHPVFWITLPSALGCIIAAFTTDPEDIASITSRQYLVYVFIIGDAIVKTLWLVSH